MRNKNFETFMFFVKLPFKINKFIAKSQDKLLSLFLKEGTEKKAVGTFLHFFESLVIPYGSLLYLHGYYPNLAEFMAGENGERFTWTILPMAFIFTGHAAFTCYWKSEQEKSPYGNAKFAAPGEIQKANLIKSDKGIVFGKVKDNFGQWKLLSKPSGTDGHVIVLGGSGLGKTKSVALPTLLRWNGSAVIVDIKGDISKATFDYRNSFQKVFVFNPTDPKNSCTYNPLDGIEDAETALETARILIPTMSGDNAYFSNTAQDLLASSLLLGKKQGRSISEICKWIRITPYEEIMNTLMSSNFAGVKELAGSGLEASENALGNVMSELRRNITEFVTSPTLKKVTSGKSDFSIKDLEEGATIYLSIPESKMNTYGKVFGLIYSQIIRHLLDRGESKEPPILLMMDEFAQLGKLPEFEERIATLRSRNVHCMVFIQSFSQLDKRYGQDGRKIILDNCRFDLVLGIKDAQTAEYYTKLSGMASAETRSKSISADPEGIPRESESIGEMSTPLIRVEEWKNLENPILFPFKCDPIKVTQTWVVKHQDPSKNFIDPLLVKALKNDLKQLEKELKKVTPSPVVIEEDREQIPSFFREGSQ